MISDDEAQRLVVKKLTGEINTAEETELDQWLQAGAANRKVLEEYTQIWSNAENAPVTINTNDAWDKVTRKMQPVPLRIHFKPLIRIAAVFLVVTFIGYLFYANLARSVTKVTTASNEIKKIDLPDGSVVWLHEFSQLSYEGGLKGDLREVELTGLAFFDVHRNEQSPFRITTPSGSVQVLGTSFEVRAFPKEGFERVIVSTGKVRFENQAGASMELTANMEGIISRNKTSVQNVNAADLTSWKDSQLSFEDETLDQVAEKMEHYFNIRIHFVNEDIRFCHFTGKFENPKLGMVLEALGSALQLTMERKGDHVYLKGKGCKQN